ncbi:MAG: TonB-dependent receptor, partial [Pseudomonadales bacterium]|nr:TonB-dependent receptor [Pseudomonadales bacterium]
MKMRKVCRSTVTKHAGVGIVRRTGRPGLLQPTMLSAAIAMAAVMGQPAPVLAADSAEVALQGQGRITGTVVNRERGEKMRGARVSIPALNIETVTDSEGAFTLRRLAPGTYTVRISYIDREDYVVDVDLDQGETQSLDVQLVRLGATDTVEEVVVVGRLIADSEAAALQRQRAADSVKNILASDSIGRFPDQNAADALGRVSGISIERDQGQARFVNVRGAPANFTNIAFNGVAAPTPSQGGRNARFDTISNHIIKSIEVQKAVTPDVPADSIGGFVNIETNGAFDKEGLYADVAVAGGIKELGGGPLQQYQFTASNTFMQNDDGGDMFGILLSASYYKDNKVTDNTENRFDVYDDGQVWPNATDYRLYRLNRSNTSLNTRLDFRPNENHGFYANFLYSDFQDFEIRDQHVYDLDDSQFGHPASRDGFDPTISNPTRSTVLGVELDATFNVRTDVESVFTMQLGGEHDFDTWHVEWVGGVNNSTSEREGDSAYWEYDINNYSPTSADDPTPREPGISVIYDYTDPDKPITNVFETVIDANGNLALGQQFAGAPIDYFVFENVEIEETVGEVDETFFQFDVERPWAPFGITSDLKFGGRYSRRNATLEDSDFEVTDDIEDFGFAFPYSSILSGRPSRATFPQPLMFEFDDTLAEAQRDAAFAAASANGVFLNQPNVWENFYDVDETVTALYAMNTFRWDHWDVIVGARVEFTQMEGIGNEPRDEDAIDDILETRNAPVSLAELYAARDANGDPILVQVDADQDYVDFFPAFHINYRPTEDLVVRFAYTETILRPSYSEFAPNRVIGQESDEQAGGIIFLSGGNPELEPYRSQNLDLYVERYLPYRGILSFGLFAKNIDDPIFNAQQQLPGAGFGFPDNLVRISGPLNGSDGEIRGFEATYSQQFGFLPSPWDGFGVQLNYTYAEDDATTPPLFNPAT